MRAVLRRFRVRWHRLRFGVDPGDVLPGHDRPHLRGRALRRAIEDGSVGPDRATRTIRSSGDEDGPDATR